MVDAVSKNALARFENAVIKLMGSNEGAEEEDGTEMLEAKEFVEGALRGGEDGEEEEDDEEEEDEEPAGIEEEEDEE